MIFDWVWIWVRSGAQLIFVRYRAQRATNNHDKTSLEKPDVISVPQEFIICTVLILYGRVTPCSVLGLARARTTWSTWIAAALLPSLYSRGSRHIFVTSPLTVLWKTASSESFLTELPDDHALQSEVYRLHNICDSGEQESSFRNARSTRTEEQ